MTQNLVWTATRFHPWSFFLEKMGFTPRMSELVLRDMVLQEKEVQKN